MTLIEIMVVMVIMATMAAAAAIGVMHAWNNSRIQETGSRARTMQGAATSYLLEKGGECPTADDLVRADILDKTTDHTDAWGHAFTLECEENTVHVRSAGPDGTFGNEDDIGF